MISLVRNPTVAGRRETRPQRLEHVAGELRPRLHLELPEDLAQVVFDRARADEELGGDLDVRLALRDEPRDLCLLWREVVLRLDGAFASVFARRAELDACSLRESFHTELGEQLVRHAQLLARVHTPAGASQPLAVEEMRAGEVKPAPSRREALDRVPVQAFRYGAVRDEGARSIFDGGRPDRGAGRRAL